MYLRPLRRLAISLSLTLCLATLGVPQVMAQSGDPNECDAPGDFPDVIVGEIQAVTTHNSVGDITAYSVGTTSCNIGTCQLNWIAQTNEHPVIGQNMYRLVDGRFEQVGQSWLKHGFFALSGSLCSNDCQSTGGAYLGVNCSDTYGASLNGQQNRLGPKYEVNATSGKFPYPATDGDTQGNAIYKRLQVHHDDVDPALNPGARYFVEGQYVTSDDNGAGFGSNNNAYNEVAVSNQADFPISLIGITVQETPAISAWKAVDSAVTETAVDVPGDGRFVVASLATDLGTGLWRYEYAVQNLTSHAPPGASGCRSPTAGASPTSAFTTSIITAVRSRSAPTGPAACPPPR